MMGRGTLVIPSVGRVCYEGIKGEGKKGTLYFFVVVSGMGENMLCHSWPAVEKLRKMIDQYLFDFVQRPFG